LSPDGELIPEKLPRLKWGDVGAVARALGTEAVLLKAPLADAEALFLSA